MLSKVILLLNAGLWFVKYKTSDVREALEKPKNGDQPFSNTSIKEGNQTKATPKSNSMYVLYYFANILRNLSYIVCLLGNARTIVQISKCFSTISDFISFAPQTQTVESGRHHPQMFNHNCLEQISTTLNELKSIEQILGPRNEDGHSTSFSGNYSQWLSRTLI